VTYNDALKEVAIGLMSRHPYREGPLQRFPFSKSVVIANRVAPSFCRCLALVDKPPVALA
jgi:hypothetical protein